MIGWTNLTGGPATLAQSVFFRPDSDHLSDVTAYPWAAVDPCAIFCDLGSGPGHVGIELLKARPEMRVYLQDLPQTMVEARAVRDDIL